jgi:GDP-D-mannose 3',5'-epimerase
MKRALVTGAGGFVGHHLVNALKAEGYFVRGVDLAEPAYEQSAVDEFHFLDLRINENCLRATEGMDEVYALAADMGGMGFLSANDADVLVNNLRISIQTVDASYRNGVKMLFYSSSACVYPEYLQTKPDISPLREEDAYPAAPQDGYGWEKLTTERLLRAYYDAGRIDIRIARFHNIYGPLGTWHGGREKAPAALCRKVAEAPDNGDIEIWGDGRQTRSFCYIDDCISGVLRMRDASCREPLNIGSDRLVTIDQLADIIIGLSGKKLTKRYVPGPQGVRGRNSDNTRCQRELGWAPLIPLEDGLSVTFRWIQSQVEAATGSPASSSPDREAK